MSRKKISTTIYVTPEQSDRLRLLHDRTKVPVAVYIREGIDLVLRQYDHLLPGQLPLASPHGDDAGVDSQPPPASRSSHGGDSTPRAAAEAKPDRAASAGKG
jgi:Ribbon-helix-helix domain